MYLKILKMGHTILFTYLKIILLQYFQFLVLTKINCTQTYPKYRKKEMVFIAKKKKIAQIHENALVTK